MDSWTGDNFNYTTLLSLCTFVLFLRPGSFGDDLGFLGNQIHSGLKQCVRDITFLLRIWMSLKSQINLSFLAISIQVVITPVPKSFPGHTLNRKQDSLPRRKGSGHPWGFELLRSLQKRNWWFEGFRGRNIWFHRMFCGGLFSHWDQG